MQNTKQKKQKKELLIETMVHNKLFIILPAAAAILATVLTLSTFTIPTFAQSEETNQTMQDLGQSTNQTGERMQQGANQTGEAIQGNASEVGAEVTEGAKKLGKNITEGAKGLAETIGKGLQDLAK